MKKLFIILILSISALSCSNDEDQNGFANIVGTWNLIETTLHAEDVRTENGVSETYLTDSNSTNITTQRVFQNDNTYQQTGGQTLNYVYTNPDNSVTEQSLNVTTIGNGTYTLNGSTLTLTVDGVTQETDATILVLNNTTLKFKIETSLEYTQGSTTIVSNFETVSTFTRQ